MRQFLLVYRRSTGELVDWKDLGEDRSSAIKLRAERERLEKDDPDLEVVVLSAADRDAVMRTHARYFTRERARDLAGRSSDSKEDVDTARHQGE